MGMWYIGGGVGHCDPAPLSCKAEPVDAEPLAPGPLNLGSSEPIKDNSGCGDDPDEGRNSDEEDNGGSESEAYSAASDEDDADMQAEELDFNI
ncbi:hypothetical protein FRC09_008244 [Ceratobasidium sp. 395]|nr:hypothetical protein FRC09_008244 [Ceratobasidium sp. 395]